MCCSKTDTTAVIWLYMTNWIFQNFIVLNRSRRLCCLTFNLFFNYMCYAPRIRLKKITYLPTLIWSEGCFFSCRLYIEDDCKSESFFYKKSIFITCSQYAQDMNRVYDIDVKILLVISWMWAGSGWTTAIIVVFRDLQIFLGIKRFPFCLTEFLFRKCKDILVV